jgi:hypothetical protein
MVCGPVLQVRRPDSVWRLGPTRPLTNADKTIAVSFVDVASFAELVKK